MLVEQKIIIGNENFIFVLGAMFRIRPVSYTAGPPRREYNQLKER